MSSTAPEQLWIFTVRYPTGAPAPDMGRTAIVGPARYSTVEAALHLAKLPEAVRVEIRACELVRRFVEGKTDPILGGYTYHANDTTWWVVCVGSVQEVVGR
jgi:hypothetical protein